LLLTMTRCEAVDNITDRVRSITATSCKGSLDKTRL
jgi:hypothetical protein